MTQGNSPAGSKDKDWIILRTPDGYDVVILIDDIKMVWSGTRPGTILIELVSREEPVSVNYSSVKRFATTYLPGWDDRKKGRKPEKKPVSLRVVSERGSG